MNRAPLSEVLLRDLRVEHADCALVEIAGDRAVRFVSAGRPTIHLVLEGRAILRDTCSQKVVELEPGDQVFAFFGDKHVIAASEDAAAVDLTLREDLREMEAPPVFRFGEGKERLRLLSAAAELTYLSPAAYAHRALPSFWVLSAKPHFDRPHPPFALDLAQVEAGSRGIGATAFATMLVAMMFVHAWKDTYSTMWHDQYVDVRSPNTRRMAAAVRAIHTHPEKPWTVARLAHEVGLSRSTFADAFHAYVGETPLAYLTRVRMKRAEQLLQIEAMSLREVANRVGYRLEGSFARVFKRHYGVAPGLYAAHRRVGASGKLPSEPERRMAH